MRKSDGRKVVTRLLTAYKEEAGLYEALAQAATEQHFLLTNGSDPDQLGALLDRQRDLAEDIGKIEAGIGPLREHWESTRDAAAPRTRKLAESLDRLLEQLAERIHNIVKLEKDSSRALMRTTAKATE